MCLVHFYEERKMRAYSETYLDDVVESQGKLFDFVAQTFPENDTTDFIEAYMKSKTRKYMSRWRMLIPWMLKNYGDIFRIQKSIN